MLKRLFFVSLVALVVMCSGAAMAAIPPYISFQGRLTDTSVSPPTPETSATNVTFGIYPSLTATLPSWEGTATITPDSDGIFNVILGLDTTTTVGDLNTLSFNGPLWVEVKVGTATTGSRQRLTTVPYAFRSKWTDNVPDPIVPADATQDISGSLAVAGGILSGPIVSLSTGNAIWGLSSATGAGNWAVGGAASGEAAGVAGFNGDLTNGGPGVRGESWTGKGVYGYARGAGQAGVEGKSDASYGVKGNGSLGGGYFDSTSGYGVRAFSSNSYGVYANSGNGTGVYGQSTNSRGVEGISGSSSSAGVYAGNTSTGPGLEVSGWIKVNPTNSGIFTSSTIPITVNAVVGKVKSPYAAAANWYTVNNSYVTSNSIILVTPQDFEISNANLVSGKLNQTTGVKDISNGSFKIYLPTTIEGGLTVAFLVINQ